MREKCRLRVSGKRGEAKFRGRKTKRERNERDAKSEITKKIRRRWGA